MFDASAFVGTCWDEAFSGKTLKSGRAKRDYEDKLLQKAETFCDQREIAALYAASHALWSQKVINQLLENQKRTDGQFEKLMNHTHLCVCEFKFEDLFTILYRGLCCRHDLN